MAAKKKENDDKEVKKSLNRKKTPKDQSGDKKPRLRIPVSNIKARFPVVGIGASAGGLEALQGLLLNIKPGCNMAFVIIQHRATEPKSVMLSLLSKYTTLHVSEIEDGMKIKPDCIYINPPHQDITIENGKLFCEESPGSLARDFRLTSFSGLSPKTRESVLFV